MHRKVDKFFHKLLYLIEILLAALTIIVLVGNLGMEAYRVIVDPSYFPSGDQFLQSILSIVVGLEFVRMLIDLTPGNLLEVVAVAIARQIILNHNDPLTLLTGVAALAGMFAIRRFLLRRNQLHIGINRFFNESDRDAGCGDTQKAPE